MDLLQLLLQDKIITTLQKKQLEDPKSLVFDKEQVKLANRILMILAHKTMGTAKQWSYKENSQIDLDPSNTIQLIDAIYAYYCIKYMESIKKIYMK